LSYVNLRITKVHAVYDGGQEKTSGGEVQNVSLEGGEKMTMDGTKDYIGVTKRGKGRPGRL